MSKPCFRKNSQGWFWVLRAGFGYQQLIGPHRSLEDAWGTAKQWSERFRAQHDGQQRGYLARTLTAHSR